MKKMYLLSWLMMLSIVAVAQRPIAQISMLDDFYFLLRNGDLNERLPFTPDTEFRFQSTPQPGITIHQSGTERSLPFTVPFRLRFLPIVKDEMLKRADELAENTYVVKNKRTGDVKVYSFLEKYAEWRRTPDFMEFSLEDADENDHSRAMVYGFVPKSKINTVLPIEVSTFENSPGAKFGFEMLEGDYVWGHFMTSTGMSEGNLRPVSRMMLRMIHTFPPHHIVHAPRRASVDDFTGEYELLFYLEFQNQTWNNETQQMVDGDEYEVYGRGTMKMHVPSVTRFQVETEKDWVRVGESMKVTLSSYAEEGATWDWNDVQIVGQSSDYDKARKGEDEGFFSWDPATQTLTSLKSNDNKDVWVYLGLTSKPSVKASLQVATGEGWKYTMIKPSQDEFTYSGYGYLSFSFDFAPKESEDETIDFNALEIDPATNADGYFSIQRGYGPQGWPIYVDNAPAGEYTVRIWVKSNHDVNCTIKVISTVGSE